jgi:hypothetical protein
MLDGPLQQIAHFKNLSLETVVACAKGSYAPPDSQRDIPVLKHFAETNAAKEVANSDGAVVEKEKLSDCCCVSDRSAWPLVECKLQPSG